MDARLRRALAVLVVGLGLAASSAAAAPESSSTPASTTEARTASKWWDDFRRGWHFYEDPPEEPTPPKPASKPPKPAVEPPRAEPPRTPPRAPELAAFEMLQKQLEEYRHVAIMNPSGDNVRRYMETERFVYQKAYDFSEATKRVSLAMPSKTETMGLRPTNGLALDVHSAQSDAEKRDKIAQIRSTHALFFFYRSDCPYCKAMAPTMRLLQDRYGVEVVAVSVDGGALREFPSFRRDNGIVATLRVDRVPATFLVEPGTGSIFPLGTGIHSETELIGRINLALDPQTRALSPQATQTLSLR